MESFLANRLVWRFSRPRGWEIEWSSKHHDAWTSDRKNALQGSCGRNSAILWDSNESTGTCLPRIRSRLSSIRPRPSSPFTLRLLQVADLASDSPGDALAVEPYFKGSRHEAFVVRPSSWPFLLMRIVPRLHLDGRVRPTQPPSCRFSGELPHHEPGQNEPK